MRDASAAEPAGDLGRVRAVALFVVGYAAFDALPVILSGDDVVKQLTLGDLVDFPLGFLLFGLYVWLGVQAGLWQHATLRIVAVLALVLLVQGHAVHLAANAIADDVVQTSLGHESADFLDEHVGHLELHAAIITLALLFILIRPLEQGGLTRRQLVWLTPLALAHGLFLAADAVEGQSVPLILPAGALLFGTGLALRRDATVYRGFFAGSFGVAVVTLAVYGAVYGGYPEISFLPFLD